MSEELAVVIAPGSSYERALILGDLAGLKADERLSYYKAVCESVGLNPLTKPFDYITLNGKMVLYATRACTDQLRRIHGVSVLELQESRQDGVLSITCKVSDKSGRTDIATGALAISNLKGSDLANALMKAETKAKRRATLSLCGLGVLDETELDTIPAEVTGPPAFVPQPIVAPAVNQAPAPAALPEPVTPPVAPKPLPPAQVTVAPAPSAPEPGLFANTTPPDPAHETHPFPKVPEGNKPAHLQQPDVIALPTVPPPPPPVAVIVQAAPAPSGDAPCTPQEYSTFVNSRATKLVRDKLPKGGMKEAEASTGIKNYLLKSSGKTVLKQISAATFDRLLKVLEDAATPEDAAAIVIAGSK